MTKISRLIAREILDSRGNPTLETSILTDNGAIGTASTPSGGLPGPNDAKELRDGDQARYHGQGVTKAVNLINTTLASSLVGQDISDQAALDHLLLKLDGSEDKNKLGGNTLLSISMAFAKAAAAVAKKPLFVHLRDTYRPGQDLRIPGCIFNDINGGKHGAGNLDFQEFHVIPSTRFPFSQSLQIAVELYYDLKNELIHRGAIHSVGDEGGFAPNLFTNSDALELLTQIVKNSPYRLNQDVFLGLDVAADSFYKNGHYEIKDANKPLDSDSLITLYIDLVKQYNLFSLEDALEQNDWDGWRKLKSGLSPTTLLVGDDLIATNLKRLQKSIDKQAINTVVIKPNQVGTITETVAIIELAKQHKINTVVSHRSGETNDSFIADFAVGMAADYTKFGAPIRGERIAKYNRLLEIETYLNLLRH